MTAIKKNHHTLIIILLITGNIYSLFSLTRAGYELSGNNNSKSDPKLKAQTQQWMQSQPVQFIENKGQMMDMEGKPEPFVLFKIEAPGMNMYITEKGITYTFIQAEEEYKEKDRQVTCGKEEQRKDEDNIIFKWARVDMELTGASIKKENIITEGRSTSFNQYFLGHCPNGITDVHSYEKVTIKEIYPGIDWVFYNSNKTGFKYDFVVHPGANQNNIKLLYRSEKKLGIDNKGNIQIKSPYGTLTEQAPVSYLEETNRNIPTIFSEKKIKSCNPNGNDEGYETEVSFILEPGTLNLELETLIIDPQLVWGTFYGGSGAEGFGNMDCDVNGNLYVTGYVISADFPTQAWGSAYFSGFSGTAWDVFILRFSNTGVLTWATYYGGANSGNNEMGRSIKIDATGNVFVTGWTSAPNFPTQTGTGSFTGAYFDNTLPLNGIAGFILRFSNAGVRTWATLIDYASFLDMALDINGNIYLAGSAGAGCPLKPWGGAYFDASIGGSGDCYIIRFSNKGMLIWATYYGGSIITNNSNGAPEFASNIITDAVGNIYVAGQATTIDFPTQTGTGVFTGAYYDNTQAGATDIFILRFSNKGVRTWATLYGGSSGVWGRDHPSGLRVDVTGNIYVTGVTDASDFPTQSWGSAYFSGYKGASDA
ncbi:MAG: SBBP repeat-containing protein, partial [Bacteroidetes bacterium]|nr:SBBP repeat-containing protein [Bacteroidota bacterium]